MWSCPSCGASVDENSQRCWGCGWRHAPDVPVDAPERYKDEHQIDPGRTHDVPSARAMERAHEHQPWTCPRCAELVDPEFEVCWNCGTTADGVEDPSFVREEDIAERDDEPGVNVGVADPELDSRAPISTGSVEHAPSGPGPSMSCRRCGGAMYEGHLLFPGRRRQTEHVPDWGAWVPEPRRATPLEARKWSDGEVFPVRAHRCEDCGLVELFARP